MLFRDMNLHEVFDTVFSAATSYKFHIQYKYKNILKKE